MKTISLSTPYEGVCLLKLNRPKQLNAVNEELALELANTLEKLEYDSNVRVVLISGAGRAFCAGGDIKDMKKREGIFSGETPELKANYQRTIQKIPLAFERMKTPTIALVNGPAIGLGCDIACMCDLRIASESSFFRESFINLSLTAGDGGTYFLARLVGYAKAMELFLTSPKILAREAKEIGLVSEVVPDEKLFESALIWAKKMLQFSPLALGYTKEALKRAFRESLADHLEVMSTYQGILQRQDDHFDRLNG